jgi:hypothetical protein
MNQGNEPGPESMRPVYDIRGGTRGEYLERYRHGTNAVLLDRDVAAVFHDSESVNETPRVFVQTLKRLLLTSSEDTGS